MSSEAYSQSKEKIRLLDLQIDVFGRAIKACEEIKSGKSETYVCKKYDIDRNYFRHLVFNNKLGFRYDKIDLPPEDDSDPNYEKYWKNRWKDYCWQEKLFCDIFDEYNIYNIPPDIDRSMDYVFDILYKDEKSKQVMLLLYKDRLSMKEVGKILNISAMRVQQIRIHTLRILRHPQYSDVLMYGIDAYLEFQAHKRAIHNNILKYKDELIDSIDSSIDTVKNHEYLKSVHLHDLGLSTRTYNALARRGYTSIYDFMGKTRTELLKIRNMGTASMQELSDRLLKYGITIED